MIRRPRGYDIKSMHLCSEIIHAWGQLAPVSNFGLGFATSSVFLRNKCVYENAVCLRAWIQCVVDICYDAIYNNLKLQRNPTDVWSFGLNCRFSYCSWTWIGYESFIEVYVIALLFNTFTNIKVCTLGFERMSDKLHKGHKTHSQTHSHMHPAPTKKVFLTFLYIHIILPIIKDYVSLCFY